MTQIRQPTQVFNSETYDDQSTISQAAFEPASGASNIQVDLNNLRTQVNNILSALNGDWYDNPFAGGGGAGGTNDIPISGDPSVQVSLNTVPIACFADVLTDITVGAGDNYVVLSVAGSEAPTQVGSLSNDTEGVIVAESALSGAPWETNELTERTGGSAISPNNLVTIRDATTLQPIQSGGRDVFALIQVENGFTNGTAFTDVTPQRVKLSFVRINAAGDDLEAVPVADIENQTINYNYPFVQYFKNIDPSCFTGSRSFVDQAASVDVTLQNAYVGGNTITTSVGEGNVTITGDQDFIVSGSVDVDVDTTGAVSIDADAASNLTVDGAQLDVATTTSGDINVSSAGVLNLDSATQTDVQSAGGTINVGTDAVATSITVGNITGATAVAITGGTGTHSIATQNAATAGAIVTLDNGGSTIGLFAGSGDPNGTVNAGGNVGSLYAETSGGQLWVNTDGATTWVQFGSAASVTLEQATENTGASPATLGGTSGATTFETQIQDTNTLSWETTASENLLSLFADAGGDVVTIGFGTGDTLDVNSATVDIDTGSYDLSSTGGVAVLGTTGIDIDSGASAPITVNTGDAAVASGNDGGDFTAVMGAGDGTGDGGNFSVVAGDSGAGATGSGGTVQFAGGDALSTNGAGGLARLIGGIGAGTGINGFISLELPSSANIDETDRIVRLENNGTGTGGGQASSLFTGTSDPNGTVTAETASLFFRDNGGTGELYLNLDGATTWEQVVTGTVSVTLQDAYDGGNTIVTTGATNIDFSGPAGGGGFVVSMVDPVTIGTATQTALNTAGSNLTFAGGNGNGTGAGANIVGDAGDGGATANGGNVIWTGGAGGSTSGNGGEVELNGGNAQTSGEGGRVFLNAGNGAGANDGGEVRLEAGDGGATGNGAIVSINGGDGGATSGQGGNVNINGGDAPTSGNGGNINLTAGVGDAASTPGFVLLSLGTTNVDEEDRIARFQNPGTNGETFDVFAGDGDPSGSVTALTGSLWVRDDGTTGEIYLNTSAGGTGTTWELVQTGASTSTWAQVLSNGNVSGGTDPVISAGDSITGVDSASTSGSGFTIRGGDHTGAAASSNGGSITINGGDTNSGTNGVVAGDVTIQGGAILGAAGGSARGGIVTIQGGNSTGGSGASDGGNVVITGGAGRDVAGEVLITGGQSTVSGFGGTVEITGGQAASGLTGGDVEITSGSAAGGNFTNGQIRITTPDVNTANNEVSGSITISSGNNGTRNVPGTNVIIEAGNSNAGAGNRAGDVEITAGAQLSATGGRGGSVIITTGDSTSASFNAGTVEMVGPNDEDEPIAAFETQGTNGQRSEFFVGTSNPDGVVTAPTGSLWARDDNTTGELYLNTSAGGSGTTWTQFATGGGNNLQQAYVAGNTITTSAAEGDLDFSGTEQFLVDMDDNVQIASAGTTLQVINDNTAGTGSAFFGTGTVTGGNPSGQVTLESGSGGGGSSSGNVVVQSGAITSGAGDTGDVLLGSGNAIVAATGNTGDVTLQSGTSTAASAGSVTVNPGSSAAGAGAALNLAGGAGATTGGAVNITGGASTSAGQGGNVLINGGAPTSGPGGNVQLTGADAAGTNQDGGSVILAPGEATGTGTDGSVVVLSGLDNTSPVFVLNNGTGTNGNVIQQFVSEVQPETVITAPAGSIAFVDNGGTDTDGELWLKTTGTGNTGWEQVATSSTSLTRDFVQGVANANITAGNDVSDAAPAANVTMDFGSFPTFPTPQAAFNTRVQVWVNGVLQRNGVTVTLGTNATDLQFNFQIFSGDIIQIQQWSA